MKRSCRRLDTAVDAGHAPEELLGPLNPQERLHAPRRLFATGQANWLRLEPKVAVVGARLASPDGVKRASKLARILVQHAVPVVSTQRSSSPSR